MDTPIERFLNLALAAPTGTSASDIRAKFDHWIEVANHPNKFTVSDQSPFAVKAIRRKARQNVRRLALRHPEIAAQITRELEAA